MLELHTLKSTRATHLQQSPPFLPPPPPPTNWEWTEFGPPEDIIAWMLLRLCQLVPQQLPQPPPPTQHAPTLPLPQHPPPPQQRTPPQLPPQPQKMETMWNIILTRTKHFTRKCMTIFLNFRQPEM